MPAPAPVALITGSARRIGATIARRLHADGFDLALHYRGAAAEMQALAVELEAVRAGSVLTLQADLSEFDRLPELVARTVGRFGRLDALVNNASTFQPTPLGTTTPAQWDTLFASNARAPFFLAQAAAPHLKASRGAIVNLADIYAERPLREHPVYCMAKAALVMATRSLALELAAKGVTVNAVCPGYTETDILLESIDRVVAKTGRSPDAARAEFVRSNPQGRLVQPGEVADAVAWLCGAGAAAVTGQAISVSGGEVM